MINQVSEVQLSYKNKVKKADRIKISNSQNCYDAVKDYYSDFVDYKEKFGVLVMNRDNEALAFKIVSEGDLTGTVVDMKEIFLIAIKVRGSSIIIFHNHPSGKLKPSESDKKITDKISKSGKMLDVNLLDHIIISSEGYYSFADEGLI